MSDQPRPVTTLAEALEEIERLRDELTELKHKYAALEQRVRRDPESGDEPAGGERQDVAPPAVVAPLDADGTTAPVSAPPAEPLDALHRLERLRESIVRAREQREQAVAEFHALVRPTRPEVEPEPASAPPAAPVDTPVAPRGAAGSRDERTVAPAPAVDAGPVTPQGEREDFGRGREAVVAAIEESEAADHPPGVHTPSALRTLLFGTRSETADEATPAEPGEAPPAPARQGFRVGPVLVALLIPAVALVLLGLWWRSAQDRPAQSAPAASEQPPQSPAASPTAGPSPAAPAPEATERDAVDEVTASPPPARVAVPVPGSDAAPASGAVAPTPPPFVIELTTTRQVWLRVTVDGERRFERMIPPGERFMFEAARDVVVRAGDAGAVGVSVGGGPVAPLGGDGQVVTRSFRPEAR